MNCVSLWRLKVAIVTMLGNDMLAGWFSLFAFADSSEMA